MDRQDNLQDLDQDIKTGKRTVLVDEKTEGVKPTGVDDQSTGMGEGDSDYLGKTNKKEENE
ncbi:hypothetical protein [Spirosoma panaciterrae]|uniref:hypothetical protein n=1 Tax=Spirosoma panaciterrae TaxID=496058 RepID=UPI000370F188|nr:hypothetical protein [Spirosoma panaciterrae]